MRTVVKAALVLGLAAVLAYPAQAQQGRRGSFGGGSLLTNEGVQKELKLSDEQKEKVKAATEKVREKYKEDFAKLREAPREEQREKGGELRKKVGDDTKKELSGVLSAEQLKRYHQIELQQMGTRAFADADVQNALKLTDEQKKKLAEIQEESRKAMADLFGNAGGNREEARKKFQEARQKTEEKVRGVLSAEQQKAWKDMTGEPFEVRFERRRETN